MQVPIPAGGHVPHTQRAYPGDGQKRNARWQKRWAEPSYVNECKRRCPTGQDIHVSGSGCTREAIRLAADPTIDVHGVLLGRWRAANRLLVSRLFDGSPTCRRQAKVNEIESLSGWVRRRNDHLVVPAPL